MIISMESSATKVPYKSTPMGFIKFMLSQKSDYKVALDDDFGKNEEIKPDGSCGKVTRFHIKAPLQEALNYPIVKLLMAGARLHNEMYSLRPMGDSECVFDLSQLNRAVKIDKTAGSVSYHKFVDYKTKGKK
ncbi:hypothetical protein [Pseudomonas veronii]